MTTFAPLALPDVIEVTPARYLDARSAFSEVFKHPLLEANGVAADRLQEHQCCTAHAGAICGLHCQSSPAARAELLQALRGTIFHIAVDIRICSPNHGQWAGYDLSIVLSEKDVDAPVGGAC